MYNIQHNPATLYTCDETSITNVQQKHTKLLGLEGTRQISFSNRRTGILCDSRQMYDSKWTLHFSVTCISKKIYETRPDELHTAWINPRVPSLGADTERDFHPVISSFHHTYKTDKIRTSHPSTGWALFTHIELVGL